MKKRLSLCIALLLALCLVLTACGSTQLEDEADDRAEDVSETDAEARDDKADAPAAPQVSDGYVFYENELFTSEIPADWELQRTKVQYFADTILEPQEGKDRWCSIVVSGAAIQPEDVEALITDYRETGVDFKTYEDTIAGQPVTIVERGGGELGISQRDIYAVTPDGTRYVMHFACPDGGVAYDFSEIREVMDHFLSHMQYK